MPDEVSPAPDPADLQKRVDDLTKQLSERPPVPTKVRKMAENEHESASTRVLEARLKEMTDRAVKAEVSRKEARREAAAYKAQIDTIKSETEAEVNEWRQKYEAKEAEHAELAEQWLAELDATEAQRDEFRTIAEAAPDERITQLERQIKLGKIREKFRGIEPDLAEGFDLDRAWKATDFDPAKVEDVDNFNAEELAAEWRKTVGGLFKPTVEGQTPAQGPVRKPALMVAAEVPSRGARDSTGSRITYKREDISPPGWAAKNPTLYEAIQNGNAVEVE